MTNLKTQTKRFLLTIMAAICTMVSVSARENNIDYSRLITAIGIVESGMNDKAVNGTYAGFLQIASVCVTECNRINKMKGIPTRYKLSDRFNRQKSIEMFHIIQHHYNNKKDIDESERISYAILLWNEGCSAMSKPIRNTKYHQQVMKIYQNL